MNATELEAANKRLKTAKSRVAIGATDHDGRSNSDNDADPILRSWYPWIEQRSELVVKVAAARATPLEVVGKKDPPRR